MLEDSIAGAEDGERGEIVRGGEGRGGAREAEGYLTGAPERSRKGWAGEGEGEKKRRKRRGADR